jgi:hypothetical protein
MDQALLEEVLLEILLEILLDLLVEEMGLLEEEMYLSVVLTLQLSQTVQFLIK